ncbi:hypothetical protein VKT23_011560 [Stygiomarasmius scandens]|uniref:Uncharacterized protein n=1 Tax=Marasmiellus scandens TaxID=2682957 RepID=A0ABR1JBX4_9AGAR
MPNLTGKNGHNNGRRPPDDELAKILHSYARKGLDIKTRLQYLKASGYTIRHVQLVLRAAIWRLIYIMFSRSTLSILNARFKVPTVKKPPPLPVAASIICDVVAEDKAAKNGPSTIQNMIRRNKNIIIPRDTVRKVMHDNFPHGAETRFPGKKVPKPRGHLKLGDGVFQEVHCDGHEKLSAKALRMGDVGMDIYGMRCHSSGRLLHEVVVPNARCSSTIGHVYLDFVEKYGEICEQLTVDGGSETGEMYACHQALRFAYRFYQENAL